VPADDRDPPVPEAPAVGAPLPPEDEPPPGGVALEHPAAIPARHRISAILLRARGVKRIKLLLALPRRILARGQ